MMDFEVKPLLPPVKMVLEEEEKDEVEKEADRRRRPSASTSLRAADR